MSITRSSVVLAVVLTALLVQPFRAAPPNAQQKFKARTLTVPVYATVTDADHRLVPDLEQTDFEVYDNGKLQALTVFENKNTPITALVMLDTSGSMTVILKRVKEAAEQFLIRLLPEDTGRVSAFHERIQFLPANEFTSDRDLLIRSLRELDFGNGTNLWDAVDEGIRRLEDTPPRKVILVFTDGDDTGSRRDLDDVMHQARAKEVMIYAIGMGTQYFNGQQMVRSSPAKGLRKLAEETGGGFYNLKKEDELGPTFTRVAQELHSQYVLGFSPQTLDGKVHKLEVKIKKPGMSARARKSYLAATSDETTR